MVERNPPHAPALALYQPDIPQNAGALIRLAACLGIECHIVGPTGFRADDRSLRRAGLDYLDRAAVVRHRSWATFEDWRAHAGRRLILATTRARERYTAFRFERADVIMVGRESAGVPDPVHAAASARLAIPMVAGLRSLNVATAAAMIVGEALRQSGSFVDFAPTGPEDAK